MARAAKILVSYQVDGGHICPISMTYSAVPALRHEPRLAREWEPRLTSRHYDPANLPAGEKTGATCGMAMTEKQGGSDGRANTTTAAPEGDASYRITGHKWFCSAPMSDMFLVLAQAPGGLTCFLVPRWRPDGTRNPIRIQRLKDKLGDRSNASARSPTSPGCFVEQMALLFQASLLLQHSPGAVADAFVASRLGDDARLALGTLPTGLAFDEIIQRARPVPA